MSKPTNKVRPEIRKWVTCPSPRDTPPSRRPPPSRIPEAADEGGGLRGISITPGGALPVPGATPAALPNESPASARSAPSHMALSRAASSPLSLRWFRNSGDSPSWLHSGSAYLQSLGHRLPHIDPPFRGAWREALKKQMQGNTTDNAFGTLALAALAYGAACFIFQKEFMLPWGPGFALTLTWVCSTVGGKAAEKIAMPALLGNLLAGILLKNAIPADESGGFTSVRGLPDYWATDIITFGLTLIFVRGGLDLDLALAKKAGMAAVRLTILPGVSEAIAVAGFAMVIFGMQFILGLTLGFILAAVSPAVVVGAMFELKKRGYGVEANIPVLVVAAASFDDVVAISGFAICVSFAIPAQDKTTTTVILEAMHGPITIVLGIIAGTMGGLVSGMTRLWDRPWKRTAVVLGQGLCFSFGAKRLEAKWDVEHAHPVSASAGAPPSVPSIPGISPNPSSATLACHPPGPMDIALTAWWPLVVRRHSGRAVHGRCHSAMLGEGPWLPFERSTSPLRTCRRGTGTKLSLLPSGPASIALSSCSFSQLAVETMLTTRRWPQLSALAACNCVGRDGAPTPLRRGRFIPQFPQHDRRNHRQGCRHRRVGRHRPYHRCILCQPTPSRILASPPTRTRRYTWPARVAHFNRAVRPRRQLLSCDLRAYSASAAVATAGTALKFKERLFIALAWLPKATVQAAFCGYPLQRILDKSSTTSDERPYGEWASAEEKMEYEQWGEDILTTGVLAILLTAPLGLILIQKLGESAGPHRPASPAMHGDSATASLCAGPRWLEQDPGATVPVTIKVTEQGGRMSRRSSGNLSAGDLAAAVKNARRNSGNLTPADLANAVAESNRSFSRGDRVFGSFDAEGSSSAA